MEETGEARQEERAIVCQEEGDHLSTAVPGDFKDVEFVISAWKSKSEDRSRD